MAAQSDPLILAMARIGREIKKAVGMVETAKSKELVLQVAEATIDDLRTIVPMRMATTQEHISQ